MKQGAKRPKPGTAGATTTKKATKTKAAAGGQAKTAAGTVTKAAAKTANKAVGRQSVSAGGQAKTAAGTVKKASAKTAGKKAAKQSVAAVAKMPASGPVLQHASKPARHEAARGGRAGEENAAAMLTIVEVDLPRETSAISAKEIEVRIRSLAYEIWEQRGRKHGGAIADWLEAEREIAGAISKDAGDWPGMATRVSARRTVK